MIGSPASIQHSNEVGSISDATGDVKTDAVVEIVMVNALEHVRESRKSFANGQPAGSGQLHGAAVKSQ
jgi:hypothetical protein